MFDFYDAIALLGALVRMLGLLVFGVAAGWFTLKAFNQPERSWQLQTAVYLGFFAFIVLVVRYTSPGGLGALGLGVGAGLLFWGLSGNGKEAEPEEEAEEEE
jgi:xanthine/uracil permease